MPGTPRSHAYVCEGPVPVVAIELRRPGIEARRIAIVVNTIRLALLLQLFRVTDETRGEQVELAVIIESEPDRRRIQARRIESRPARHVFKGPVTAIPVERVAAISGHQQIDKSIAVVIGRGRSDCAPSTCFLP